MPFSTGMLTNTRDFGTAATNIVVNARNLDLVNSATVEVQIFAVPIPTLVLTPVYQAVFVVGPNNCDIVEYFIAGNVSYEVQLAVTGTAPANVLLSSCGIDAFGNLVTDQRVLQSELTFITALTPI